MLSTLYNVFMTIFSLTVKVRNIVFGDVWAVNWSSQCVEVPDFGELGDAVTGATLASGRQRM